MVANLWFFYALGASLFWGMGYVLSEKLLREGLTPAFIMTAASILSLPIWLAIASASGDLKSGLEYIGRNKDKALLLVLTALMPIGGNFLILLGIAGKNATLASLVEISYPIFTFIFAWLILKDIQLTWGTAFGAMLIISGIAVVYLKG